MGKRNFKTDYKKIPKLLHTIINIGIIVEALFLLIAVVLQVSALIHMPMFVFVVWGAALLAIQRLSLYLKHGA